MASANYVSGLVARVLLVAFASTAAPASAELPEPKPLALPEFTACVEKVPVVSGEEVLDVRVALLRPGYEHTGHELYVQWLAHSREQGETVVASLLASASMYPASCPRLTLRTDGGVEIKLERTFPFSCYGDEDWKSTLTLIARRPGVLEIAGDVPGPPRADSCVP